MKKRLLSAFMALALCLTLLPAPAWAAEDTQEPDSGTTEDYVVQVTKTALEGTGTETKYYNNLPDAFDAANSSTFTDSDGSISKVEVKLLKNGATYDLNELNFLQLGSYPAYPLRFDYTEGVKVIIDLNGCTLKRTVSEMQQGILLVEQGDVTVKNGTLELDDSGSVNPAQAIDMPMNGENPTLTLENMTITVADIPEDSPRGDQGYAIDAKGGMLDLQGNTLLDGGLIMSGDAQLKNKLTAGTFTNSGSDTYSVSVEGSTQYGAVFDLLEPGYAFAKYDENAGNKAGAIVDGSVKQLTEDVIVVAHTHNIVDGSCECGKQFEAGIPAVDGTITYYETIDEAFANVKANETVKLMIDSDDRDRQDYIYVVGGPYTFDLNGHRVGHRTDDDNRHQAFLQVGDPDGNPGTLTVLDSSKTDDTEGTGYFYELKLYNGSLTVESGSFYRYWESATTATGTMTFKGGTVDVFTVTSRNVETKISGGTFGLVENNIDGKPGDLLADNRAFFNRDNNFVNGYDYQTVRDVVVKDHTHSIVDGVCACGFTCAHDWSDKNGVCKKANCGYHCPHNAGATEADGVWACNTCGQTVTAMVTAPGGAITYYADGYVNNNKKSGLYFAIKAAETGSTVVALGGEYSGGYVTGGKTLTLDMSNGKTIDGILYVGEKDTGNKLIVRGNTEISYVIVTPGNNTLDLTGWTGRIGFLAVQNGGKATLNGGTFAKLNFNDAAAGSLLASGYAFQNADTGAYVEYSSTDNMENVKVVKCPHSGVTLKEDHTGAECKYCGASFAATLDDAPYGTIDAAVTDWLKNGGTLKLYGDYTATDGTWRIGSGLHTINLNGHKMSVQGDGAFKPTNNMHLTVTDGKEIGQITNILLDGSQRGSFTLESGYVGEVGMTGGAVVALKGGSVDKLDVQNCSANTNLSIQGGSIGELNIKDWADDMHVSATSGSLGAYNLPSGKILADVLDHQYYAEGTSLDRYVDTAQRTEKFVIKQAPHDFGSTSKAADVPINGSIPFMVDSPSENVGVYEVKWYRRTNSGAEHMVENKVADVNVGDRLDVFCVITGLDRPGGAMQWQVAVKDYTIKVVPADLSQEAVVFKQVADGWGAMGNIKDGKGTFVFAPWEGNTDSPTELRYLFEVSCNGRKLTAGSDYTVTGGSTAKWAGTYTLTIEGKGNYTGTATHQWEIKPYTLSKNLAPTRIVRNYDGTTNLSAEKLIELGCFLENRNSKNPSLGADQNRITIRLGAEDFEVSNVKLGSAEVGDTTASFTIKLKPRPGQTAANFVFEDGTSEMTVKEVPVAIPKAYPPSPLEAGELNVANDHAGVYTLDLSKLLPKLDSPMEYGKVTYALDTVSINGGYYDAAKGSAEVKDGKLILPIQAVAAEATGKIGTVTVKVTSGNIVDFDLTINVNATNKIVPTGAPTLSKTTLAWGEQLSTITLSGTMTDPTDSTKTVKGKFEWVAPGAAKEKIGEYEAAWKFTPDENAVYTEAAGTVTITVTKATPKGAPDYTKITTTGKTLKDANLTAGTIQPEGTIQWEQGDKTVVTANTAYKWVFTPKDTEHYDVLTGSITPYSVSSNTGGSSGGGSSSDRDSSDSNPVIKTETKNHADGSTTKTETRRDGSVTQTTTAKDGSVSKTETKKDGSSVTENKAADGSTGTVKTGKNGQTEAKTALSNKAIEDAKKNGEAVKAPVEVEASRDSSTAPTVKVELPKGAGETKVEIPVSNVKPGTVAVLVHPDGTEEIVKNSIPTEDGIQLTVDGNATVKIIDNSKDFIDTRNHWAEDAIDFVSARGLVNGMTATIYAPNNSTTRAQLWTILARQNDADLSGGSVWYEKAQNWAKDKGVSDGANPNAAINRAQMVTMLWRAEGQPTAGSTANFTDVPADTYYAGAVSWAVENGITTGVGNGKFNPAATCTRAQIAAFLTRLYAEK